VGDGKSYKKSNRSRLAQLIDDRTEGRHRKASPLQDSGSIIVEERHMPSSHSFEKLPYAEDQRIRNKGDTKLEYDMQTLVNQTPSNHYYTNTPSYRAQIQQHQKPK